MNTCKKISALLYTENDYLVSLLWIYDLICNHTIIVYSIYYQVKDIEICVDRITHFAPL